MTASLWARKPGHRLVGVKSSIVPPLVKSASQRRRRCFFLHAGGGVDDEDEGAGRWVVYNTIVNRRRSLVSRNPRGRHAITHCFTRRRRRHRHISAVFLIKRGDRHHQADRGDAQCAETNARFNLHVLVAGRRRRRRTTRRHEKNKLPPNSGRAARFHATARSTQFQRN